MGSPYPPPRIIIAANNDEGKSIYVRDDPVPTVSPFGPKGSQMATFYSTATIPASNTAPLPPLATTSIPRPGPKGTVFCTSDIPPGIETPFHRTSSVDYIIVLKGEIVCRLNHGVEKTIREGEMLVQCGTIHAWENRSEMWCRLLAVMIAAEPVVLGDGTVLGEVSIPPKPKV